MYLLQNSKKIFTQIKHWMAAKRHLFILPHKPSTDSTTTTTTPDDNASQLSQCVVCSDKARFINYGALSCQSCKTFFRRNGFRPETVRPCTMNGNCEIDMLTRHICTACRLAKCLSMGMSSDLIRKEDLKKTKRSSSISSNLNTQITTTPQLSTNDIQFHDQSLLSDTQWTLLSNIVHAYDKYNVISQIQQNLLTFSDEVHKIPINPVDMINQMCKSMILFISSLPDFRILTSSEQICLLKRNFHGVIGFYSTYVFRQTGIFNRSDYSNAFLQIYGTDIISSIKNVIEQLDSNETVIKIVLIIIAFSSHSHIDTNRNVQMDSLLYGTFRLLGSQNVYVELLWNYLIYQYGYERAALRFTQLIQIFLCILKNLAMLHGNNEIHRKISDNIVESTKQMLSTIVNEHTPLWGKVLTS
ncbi:hypothetical protein I4U23_010412 [Adineta vaga]|nr:hypothetical protein I4U23_010412 [Adineta vaga]